MKINKRREKMERKNGGGNSDSAEVVTVKLFKGVKELYSKPPANSRFKYLQGQRCYILRQPIDKFQSLEREVFLGLE